MLSYRLHTAAAVALYGGEVLLDVGVAVGEVVVPLDAGVFEAAGAVIAEIAVLLLKLHTLEINVRQRF